MSLFSFKSVKHIQRVFSSSTSAAAHAQIQPKPVATLINWPSYVPSFVPAMVSSGKKIWAERNIQREVEKKAFLPSFPASYMHSVNNEDYTAEYILTKYLQSDANAFKQQSPSPSPSQTQRKTRIFTICGGGDTTPSLLSCDEIRDQITIDCADLSEEQIFLCDLKFKAILNIADREECQYFLVANSKFNTDDDDDETMTDDESERNARVFQSRIALYNDIRKSLYSDDCRLFWDNRRNDDISHGVIGCSVYDRILLFMRENMNDGCHCGDAAQDSIESQLKDEFLPVLFNYEKRPRVFSDNKKIGSNHKSILNNFQTKKNGSDSYLDNYYYTLIRDLDFAHECGDEDGYPLWLKNKNYHSLRDNISVENLSEFVKFHIGDAIAIAHRIAVVENQYKYDLISLSNALEWMSPDAYASIVSTLSQCMSDGGILLHRFHLLEDKEMQKQLTQWNRVLRDSGEFLVLEEENELHRQVFVNERSKFGFEPQCISIAIKQCINDSDTVYNV